jgi:dipeptide/tripeptide permease
MPKAELPTSRVGWLVALGAAFVGFLAGFVFITICNRMAP